MFYSFCLLSRMFYVHILMFLCCRSQDVPFFPVTSSGSALFVVASNFISNQSFTADFSTVKPGCSVVSTETVGNYNLLRDNFQKQCSWTVNPQLMKGSVLLKLESVNLCPKETVTLYQGLSESGTIKLATLTNKDNKKVVPLFSSPAKSGIKVVVNQNGANCSQNTTSKTVISAYYSIKAKDCTGILSTPNGEITSPEFPNQYPLNSRCTWKTPLLNKKVFYFSLNQMQLNNIHYLNISMLKNSTPKQLVSYTGKTLPPDFLVSLINKTVIVNFDATSNGLGKKITTTDQGFDMSYRYLDCGGYFTQSTGKFGIPKASTANTECIWIVKLPKTGANQTTNIVSFNLTSSSMAAVKKNVVIRDGGSVRDNMLIFNTTKDGVKSILSRTNFLWVKYTFKKEDSNMAASGFTFNLEYKTYNWKCNGVDDCGDNTDEQNCAKGGETKEEGVKVYIVVIVALLCFAIGVVLTIILPAIYKRIRYPNYSQLKDMMEPSVA
ncbi:hypothetical protein KUTeg_024786 [Tegillarca granosa]|uniref:CUB domain-containing protein n=1 Tax=Tegillarca granosa TaxID=220873 RepID=A0ABQ9E413_TEGGR|nr:hypothetical protein KUTeg_024786 [Tegillarca granosa]